MRLFNNSNCHCERSEAILPGKDYCFIEIALALPASQ